MGEGTQTVTNDILKMGLARWVGDLTSAAENRLNPSRADGCINPLIFI